MSALNFTDVVEKGNFVSWQEVRVCYTCPGKWMTFVMVVLDMFLAN